MYMDSANVYSYMVRSLVQGKISEAFHPDIPSLNVVLAWGFAELGLRPEQALTLVSSLFYIGTIWFVYLLLKGFLTDTHAAIGAMLFAFAPKIIRFSCTSIIDSGKIFFLVAALFFLYRLQKDHFKTFSLAIGFGVALGGLSLARSEGSGLALLLMGFAAIYFLNYAVRKKEHLPWLPITSVIVVWGLFVFSRMLLMKCVFGKFIFDSRIEKLANYLFSSIGIEQTTVVSDAESAIAQLHVSWMTLFENSLRGGYEVYLVFTVIGIIIFVFALCSKNGEKIFPDKKIPAEIRWDNFFFILFLIVMANEIIFKIVGVGAYRYFLPIIPLMMIFTVTGVVWVWRWLEKYLPRLIIVIIAGVILLFQIINGAEHGFSQKARNRYECGKYIENILNDRNACRIWFGKAKVEWYFSGADRACRMFEQPQDVRTFSDFDYALFEKDEKDISIIASRDDLLEIKLPENSAVRLFKKIR